PLLERAVTQAAADQCKVHQSLRIACLAEAELLAGNVNRAAALGEDARQLARSHGERGAEGYILRILGDIEAVRRSDDPGSALNLYEQALSRAKGLAMRPLRARWHAALGRH